MDRITVLAGFLAFFLLSSTSYAAQIKTTPFGLDDLLYYIGFGGLNSSFSYVNATYFCNGTICTSAIGGGGGGGGAETDPIWNAAKGNFTVNATTNNLTNWIPTQFVKFSNYSYAVYNATGWITNQTNINASKINAQSICIGTDCSPFARVSNYSFPVYNTTWWITNRTNINASVVQAQRICAGTSCSPFVMQSNTSYPVYNATNWITGGQNINVSRIQVQQICNSTTCTQNVGGGGGSAYLTPWVGDIDAAGYNLNNAGNITANTTKAIRTTVGEIAHFESTAAGTASGDSYITLKGNGGRTWQIIPSSYFYNQLVLRDWTSPSSYKDPVIIDDSTHDISLGWDSGFNVNFGRSSTASFYDSGNSLTGSLYGDSGTGTVFGTGVFNFQNGIVSTTGQFTGDVSFDAFLYNNAGFSVDSSGNVYIPGTLTTAGGSDPPYELFFNESRLDVLSMVRNNVPPERKDGLVTFYNKQNDRMEFLKPSDCSFYINVADKVTGIVGLVRDQTVLDGKPCYNPNFTTKTYIDPLTNTTKTRQVPVQVKT